MNVNEVVVCGFFSGSNQIPAKSDPALVNDDTIQVGSDDGQAGQIKTGGSTQLKAYSSESNTIPVGKNNVD